MRSLSIFLSDCPHQYNYCEQDGCTNILHDTKIAKASAWEESASYSPLSLWMSWHPSQPFSSVALSTPDFAKTPSRLPPNWLDTKGSVSPNDKASLGFGLILVERSVTITHWGRERCSAGCLSSINRAVSRLDIHIFVFCLCVSDLVMFGYAVCCLWNGVNL